MKKYKFITIQQHENETFRNKSIYRISSNKNGDELGLLFWHSPWKQYVFSSHKKCVFNDSCLRDILDFMSKVREKVGDKNV